MTTNAHGCLRDSCSCRVLVADDDEQVVALISRVLRQAGFECAVATDGLEAVRLAEETRPDVLLLDVNMPGLPGSEVMARLRSNFWSKFIPVIFITGDATQSITHLLAGGDDYIVKPFDANELLARVHVALRRARALREINPLTGLPGNTAIAGEMASRLGQGAEFACLYVDVDNFKPYNDSYGFAAGDKVIEAVCATVVTATENHRSSDNFVGHIGGDDFVVLTDPELAVTLARDIARQFDAALSCFYPRADLARGWIDVIDRRGLPQRCPLVSVSIGIVSTATRRFISAVEVADVAAEMKAVAKRTPGSSWAVDRRKEVAPCVSSQPSTAVGCS